MSLLNHLQFQEIDLSDDIFDSHRVSENILLDEPFDEGSLERFWDKVIDDIHQDPDWFTFAEE